MWFSNASIVAIIYYFLKIRWFCIQKITSKIRNFFKIFSWDLGNNAISWILIVYMWFSNASIVAIIYYFLKIHWFCFQKITSKIQNFFKIFSWDLGNNAILWILMVCMLFSNASLVAIIYYFLKIRWFCFKKSPRKSEIFANFWAEISEST